LSRTWARGRLPGATSARRPPLEATGGIDRVPRISRWSKERWLGRHIETQFGQIGLTQDTEAGSLESTAEFVIHRWHRRQHHIAACAAGTDTAKPGTDILQKKR